MTRRHRVAAGLLLCGLLAAQASLAQAPSAAPGPPESPQWWFDTWQVPSLWSGGARGHGVTIAEIDTGVNAAVPELAASLLPGKDFGSRALDGRTDHEVERFGHGTAMASIMVARPGAFGITGLAPDAKVLPIAVPIHGTDDAAPSGNDHVPEAIRWAADHGARIISLSLGGRRYPSRDALPCPKDEQAAVIHAIDRGAIVVAAAGNSAGQGSPVEDPGVCLGVVSVGAVDRWNAVAEFSSRHRYLTLSAPGVDIPTLSRIPGTAFSGDGTSQATAVTAASLALVWSKHPTLSGRQVLARLLATLDRRRPTRDPSYGFGIVNTARAVTAAVPADAPNPVYTALDPFLGRRSAGATHPTRPPAPTLQHRPPGAVLIGDPPGLLTAPVVAGGCAAIAAAGALLVLAVVGIRSRRRRRAALAVVEPGAADPEQHSADAGRSIERPDDPAQ